MEPKRGSTSRQDKMQPVQCRSLKLAPSVTSKLVREILFADDSPLVTHCSADMQNFIEKSMIAASQFSLKINIKKIECLYINQLK